MEKRLAHEEMHIVYIGLPGNLTMPDGEEKNDFLVGVALRKNSLDLLLQDTTFAETDLARKFKSLQSN